MAKKQGKSFPETLYVYEDRWGDGVDETTLVSERAPEDIAVIGSVRTVAVYQLVGIKTVKVNVEVTD